MKQYELLVFPHQIPCFHTCAVNMLFGGPSCRPPVALAVHFRSLVVVHQRAVLIKWEAQSETGKNRKRFKAVLLSSWVHGWSTGVLLADIGLWCDM